MYVPNNLAIFTAAFAGALAGMSAANRVPTDGNPVDYTGQTNVAGAFAQELDTQWGATPSNSLSVTAIEQLAETAWQDRFVNDVAPFNLPSNYTQLCQALIAIAQAGGTYFTTEGITPAPSPSGGGVTSVIIADIAALSGLDTAELATGNTARMLSLMGTSWILDKASALVPDGITVIAANGGGNWLRQPTDVVNYCFYTDWYWDSINGNDEADGKTPATAIKTLEELNRRLPSRYPLVGASVLLPVPHQQVVLHVLQKGMDSEDTFNPSFSMTPGGLFVISGSDYVANTPPLFTGVILAATPMVAGTVAPAVDAEPWKITCAAILDWTPYLNKRIRVTASASPANIGKTAFIGANVGGTAWISPPMLNNGAANLPQDLINIFPTYTFGTGISAGDSFVIEDVPDVYFSNPSMAVASGPVRPGTFGLLDIAVGASSGFLARIGGSSVTYKGCIIKASLVTGPGFGVVAITNCCFANPPTAHVRNIGGLTFVSGGLVSGSGIMQCVGGQFTEDFDALHLGAPVNVQGGNVKLSAVQFFNISAGGGHAVNLTEFGGTLAVGYVGVTGAARVGGTGNTSSGVNVSAGFTASRQLTQANNVTVKGTVSDFRLGNSTLSRGFDEAAAGGSGIYTQPLANTWALLNAPVGVGPAPGYTGLGNNAHNVANSTHLVSQ